MFIAMNRFRIARGREGFFEDLWRRRESFLEDVAGFGDQVCPILEKGVDSGAGRRGNRARHGKDVPTLLQGKFSRDQCPAATGRLDNEDGPAQAADDTIAAGEVAMWVDWVRIESN